jgi:hypothetical protein
MSTLVEMVATEVTLFYVTPSWVARHYKVPKLAVYRAIQAGRLTAIKIDGGSLVLDRRTLPMQFPRP